MTTNWVQDAIENTNTKRANRKRYAYAMKNHLASHWDTFTMLTRDAVNAFNAGTGSAIKFEPDGGGGISIYPPVGNAPRLDLKLDPDEEVLSYAFDGVANEGAGLLTFDVDSEGLLTFVRDDQPIKSHDLVRELLVPLFKQFD